MRRFIDRPLTRGSRRRRFAYKVVGVKWHFFVVVFRKGIWVDEGDMLIVIVDAVNVESEEKFIVTQSTALDDTRAFLGCI